ncbi:receptor like protein 21 isoform X1 [Helianthus annuus]|uniref:receptor like protein 21 isoform X1 n=1 Tax=Helianthus annuus TaxID=4232 RepID=UPI0016532714|nr:receptor like protein 21 isoform X1 [Helianthus annuus]
MATWCSGKHKSPLLIFMLLLIFMVGRMQGRVCIEDERKALLEIKASIHELAYRFNIGNLLATWVDHGVASGECCDWERIKCDKTTGYITHLSLGNILSLEFEVDEYYDKDPIPLWQLNFSHFLHFKELKSLDLSWNYIGKPIADIGLEPLSSLKKLELLNLSTNYIETHIFPSLGALTSLKILDLSYINSYEGDNTPPFYDISEFSILENLEVLDLTQIGCYGTLQGSEAVSILKKLKVLNLRGNQFNESLITSLGALSSLKSLDLSENLLSGSFPAQELSNLANLEKLDLSLNKLNCTPSIQDCKSLMRLERLETISLGYNNFNKSIISCISFLPSLKILDLSGSLQFGSSFPTQELSLLRKLKTLDLSFCEFQSHTFNELPNLPDLEVLMLNQNNFNGTLPMAGKRKQKGCGCLTSPFKRILASEDKGDYGKTRTVNVGGSW